MLRKCIRHREERKRRYANRCLSDSTKANEGDVDTASVQSDNKQSKRASLYQRDSAFPFHRYRSPDMNTLESNDLVKVKTVLRERKTIREKRRRRRDIQNARLPSRICTLTHRISQLNECFNLRKAEKESIESKFCSWDFIFVMISFRFMSKRQLCLDRDHEGPLIPSNVVNMELVKTLIFQIVRWMYYHSHTIETQPKTFRSHSHPYDEANDSPAFQNSNSHGSDSCSDCPDSNALHDQRYSAPAYLLVFLKRLDETTDLTLDYIDAHKRSSLQGIEDDDDGLSEEMERLRFVEIEIEKELIEIDAQRATELSMRKSSDNFPNELGYMDGATATDAFYNAFVAITSDSSCSSDDKTTFDVQNARETVLKLVNQIQSQLPPNHPNETPQDLPQVQKKIMNDLLMLSQNPSSLVNNDSSYEISIDLKTSVSSIGCDLDENMSDDEYDIDDHSSHIAFERSDSVEYLNDDKTNPTLEGSSEGLGIDLFPDSDVAIQVDREEDSEELFRVQSVGQGLPKTYGNSNIVERTGKTIWTTLLDRRQKSTQKSDRRSPFPPNVMVSNTVSSYMQFKKVTSPNQEHFVESVSDSTENSLEVERKYCVHENRADQEHNCSIEVILNDCVQFSKVEGALSHVTSCPDESNFLLSEIHSNRDLTNTLPAIKSAVSSKGSKSVDLRGQELISTHINKPENAMHEICCMPNESTKNIDQNDLGEIAWSLSPTIDPLSITSNSQSLIGSTESAKTNSQNVSVDRSHHHSDVDNALMPIEVLMTDNEVLQCVGRSEIIENDIRSPTKNYGSISPRSPKLFDYWQSLLTHSFSPTFDESIENEPIYVVHSTGSKCNSELIENEAKISSRAEFKPAVKDDPSGRYSEGGYSETSLDPNVMRGYDSACSIARIPQEIEGIYASFEFESSIGDQRIKYEEYDPFEAARKIPEVYSSEADSIDENLERCRSAGKYEEPIHLVTSNSNETIYFDAEDVKLCVSVNSSFEAIEVSDSSSSIYYTLPSISTSAE